MSHADLSPSSASRWLRCSGSVGFIKKLRELNIIPLDNSSSSSDEGTLAHAWAAKALEAFDLGLDFDYTQIEDPLMANHIRAYVDLVASKITGSNQLLIEQRMPLFYGFRGEPEKQAVIFDKEGSFWLRFNNADLKPVVEGPFESWDEAKSVCVSDYEPLGYWIEECGTSDVVILTDEALFIIDLKYGQGVSVDAKDNEQLGIYAESFIKFRKLRAKLPPQFDVQLIIFQPRDRSSDLPPVREWPTSLGELDALHNTGEGVSAKAARLQGLATGVDGKDAFQVTLLTIPVLGQPDQEVTFRGHLVAGAKQCRFCPCKPKCGTYERWSLGEMVDACETAPNTALDIATGPWLAPDQIGMVLSDEKLVRIAAAHIEGKLTDWLDSVVKYVQSRMMDGADLGGGVLKLVKANKHRAWASEEAEGAALKLLRQKVSKDLLVTEKLVTPTQAWALVPKDVSTKFKNKLDSLIVKPEGDATLVLASDKRPALEIKRSAAEEFGDTISPEPQADDLL